MMNDRPYIHCRRLWLSLAFLALCAEIPFAACLAAQPDTSADATNQQTASAGTFSGRWLWAEGDDRFTLRLTQKGGKLSGFHTAQHLDSGRVDAVSSGLTPSITGNVHGTSVVVLFRSGAPGSEAYGHARLTLRGHYLYWELMDSTGEHYLPANAVLIRQRR